VKALVTGGAGFIGSNLVDALVARGDDVVVIDDLSTGRPDNLEQALAAGVQLHEADITDTRRLRELFEAQRPEVVYHLAAQIDVRRAVAEPGFDARVNVEGTVNVLESARAAGARRVVYSSTGGAIYGEVEDPPAREDAPLRPMAPYGQSKFAGEGYCELYQRLHGLSTVSLRYGNVYGPRQDPLGEAGVIAIFCGRARDGGRPTVYGDGRQTRDYVYVEDVVAANLAAGDAAATGAFNVGTGTETSVLELVDALRELARADRFEPEHAPARKGEIERSAIDPTRAREELGWEPRVGLHDGLHRTLAALDDATAGGGPS
jgi:UDP-glucose 4-epimerase